MKVRYSRRALSQLASVHEYLVERSPTGEHNVVASLRATVARLRNLSGLGKRTDEPGVHVLIEPKYRFRVFYRLEDTHVVVLSILHRSQE
jgi:toxin ParE1/3/4